MSGASSVFITLGTKVLLNSSYPLILLSPYPLGVLIFSILNLLDRLVFFVSTEYLDPSNFDFLELEVDILSPDPSLSTNFLFN